MSSPEPGSLAPTSTAAARRRSALERALVGFTWAAALTSILALLLGLRDAPRQALRKGPTSAHSGAEAARARLCVEVRSQQGGGLARARAVAYRETTARTFLQVGEVTTDGNGLGCMSGVEAGNLWVLADALQFARASTHLLFAEDRTVRLELPRASALQVTVTDELGAPLGRATVLVRGSDPLPYGALSEATGLARFNRLPTPPFSVRVAMPGYESSERAGVRANFSVALRRLASIDVLVLDAAGAPVPSAAVVIAGSSLWPARRADTEQDGRTRIRGLSAGSYDLRAQRGVDVSEPLVGYELARGAQENLTLRLTPGRMVTALVTDGEGQSPLVVRDADVVLVEGGIGSFPLRGRTGADGKVTLGPIARGPASLGASADDFVGGPLLAVPEKLDGPLRIALLRGGTLEGLVVDARGVPIDGASIEVVGNDRYGLPIAETPFGSSFREHHFAWSLPGPEKLIPSAELGVMPGPVPPIPPLGAPVSGASTPLALKDAASRTSAEPWVTRGTGEFKAQPVTPGRVRALVRHPEFVEGASDLVTIAPGGSQKVRVTLLRGGGLEGRVIDERGFPIPGAEISLSASRGVFERSSITATDGAFAFAAVPAEVHVAVARPDDPARTALRKRIEVPEGRRRTIELVLPAPRESVRLVVLDDADAPVELAEVRLASLDPDVPLRTTVFTDAAGSAELADARGLPLRLTVEAPRFAARAVSVDSAPAEIRISLDPGVLITGRVTAVRGRRTVPGALITLRSGTERKTTLTDAEGAYRFVGIAVGEVELSVSHPDYAEASLASQITRTSRADRPLELPPIDLLEPGEIEGRVVDAEGQAVAGARVAVGLAPAYLPAGALPSKLSLTGADGSFTLRGVAPGRLKLGAHAPSIGRGSVDGVVVESGRTTRDVVLKLTEPVASDTALGPGSIAITLAERGSGTPELVIVDVANSSDAERTGLRTGDVLLHIDGETPSSMADARARLSGREGSDVVLDLLRDDARIRMRVTREAVRR